MAKAKEQRKRIQRAIKHLVDTALNLEVAAREMAVISYTVDKLFNKIAAQLEEETDADSEETDSQTQKTEEGQGGS